MADNRPAAEDGRSELDSAELADLEQNIKSVRLGVQRLGRNSQWAELRLACGRLGRGYRGICMRREGRHDDAAR
jgi:hypothetical protein